MLNRLSQTGFIRSSPPAVLVHDYEDPVTFLLLSMLPVAAMLLGADGHLVQANVAARNLLDLADGLERGADGRVRASLPADNDKLSKLLSAAAIEMAAETRLSSVPPLWLQRPSGHPPLLLVFDAVPLSPVLAMMGMSMLLRVLDEDRGMKGRLGPLRTAFNLTVAETKIAEQIAIGRSPIEAAKHLDLSRNTVRTHLARIFDKTGVRSQHALVRLMMALSSWPTP